jgi:hypothetical protein
MLLKLTKDPEIESKDALRYKNYSKKIGKQFYSVKVYLTASHHLYISALSHKT